MYGLYFHFEKKKKKKKRENDRALNTCDLVMCLFILTLTSNLFDSILLYSEIFINTCEKP